MNPEQYTTAPVSQLELKLRVFWEGWHSVCLEEIMLPDATQKPGEDQFYTWAERLEPLSIFECRKYGKEQATEYLTCIGN